MNTPTAAFTNEELVREMALQRAHAKSLLELLERKFGSVDHPDVEARVLRMQVLSLVSTANSFEELVRLRRQAEPPGSPVTGEGFDTRPNGG